ncbi:MAG: hypothetical protein WAV32_06390 [Halobacteriota archaeon]
MGEVEAKRDRVTRRNRRHDRHTVSLLTDHKTFKKSFIKNASQSVGHGWEMVEKYISGQKGYEKTDTVPVIAEEKEKAHKTWYNTLYNKLFWREASKIEKSKSFYIAMTYL